MLEQRLRERTAAVATIPRAPRDEPLPLSFGQERLWLLHHLEPGNPVYNSPYLYQLRGALDRPALEQALRELVRRHESLRTCIVVRDGVPRQVVQERDLPALETEAVASLDEARTRARDLTHRPFDLTQDLLLRARLFQLSADEHVFLLVAHHSAWDAWSTQAAWRDIAALYAAFRAGTAADLPALSVQYADYAAWQHQRLRGERLERLLGFWRQQLADAPPLELPTDRPRPAELDYAGDTRTLAWPAGLRDELTALGRADNASLFMVLLTGWTILLQRLSEQDTVVTGTAVAGRAQRELEPLIGFFVNTLALRIPAAGNPSFRELLRRVRDITLAAYDHDELPFEKLVADLRVPRDPARHPLFQTAFVLHSAPPPAPSLAGLEIRELPRLSGLARFDLALTMTGTADGLRGVVEFSTTLFDGATIERWLRHLETLLRAAVADPDASIVALPLLTPAERGHLLDAWAGEPAPYPRDRPVHELFAEHAVHTPDAIALVEGSVELTYAIVDARAEKLAQHLLSRGVKPGGFVAIELDRSIAFVVAVLAILKAGAAYVPLSRDLPAARRRFMLEDTRAAAVIVAGSPVGDVPDGVQVINVAASLHDPPAAHATDHDVRKPAASATDAAYVMYTSGSTGQPKGVVLPHRGIVRLVRGQTPSLYAPGQRFLLLASTAFDASTFEMWAPLLNGGTLVIFPERWPEFDPLGRIVREQRITHLFLTAGLFNQVVEHRPDILATVQHLFTGGEAMSARHAARARELWPNLRLTNCYGPTEITTYTISHELAAGESWPGGNVPIGRPVPNSRAYILDERGEPVPPGVPGELYLGGDGLALGYLHQPERTAERFSRDPFVSDVEARRYRTGDRARWRADGVIEFRGRNDDQVKIRGYRIEPGEIEAVLAHHPAVREAAVMARHESPAGLRLVAYVVSQPGEMVSAVDLLAHLADRLPDYLVPAAVVFMERLPRTTGGKVDRRALPAPDANVQASGDAAGTEAVPRTPLEAQVAAVWRAALGREMVGRQDDFFALGGHSLLAMQATARLGAALGREVPLRWWFDHPTVAGLAARLAREQAEENDRQPIPVAAREGRLPLSHEEQRLWFLQHVLPDPATYHVVWSERLRGPLDLERLRAALGRVMERHEILRTAYHSEAGVPWRDVAASCDVPLRLEEPERPPGAGGDLVLHRFLSAAVRQPFHLERAPLWRVIAVRLGADDHLLTFVAHHLICDEWSLPVWRRELLEAYAGAQDSLPYLPIQYADYAAWQRRRVEQAPTMQEARSFWREHLRGAPPRIAWPASPGQALVATGAGRRVFFPLDPAAVEQLERIAREEKTTPFVAWLSLYAALLGRWTRQLDIVVGSPLAQRERAELQGLIGFFLNTLPLRLRATTGLGFCALLRQVRSVVREAFAHGQLPLDEIAALQRGSRGSSGAALFSVMFVVHDAATDVPPWPGFTSEALALGTGTSKADLTLFIERPATGEPRGSMEYSTDVLPATAIDRAIGDLQHLLELVAADADTILLDPSLEPVSASPATTAGSVTEERPALAADEATPASAIERDIAAIWSRLLRRETIGRHENFFAVGGHSLLALQVVHEIQRHFGRTLSVANMLAFPTIAGLAGLLGDRAPTLRTAAVVWKGAGQGTPYFHVPGMNGVEFLPAAVAEHISPDRRWFDGLQHPGVDGREAPARSLPVIAKELVRQIRALQPRGPYALGGFCHGGMVAYEVARQLEAEGEIVRALVLWDTFPRRAWRWRRPLEAVRVVRQRLRGPGAGVFLADRLRFWRHRLGLGAENLWYAIRAWLPGRSGRVEARLINAGMHARWYYTPMVVHAPVLLVRSRDERVLVERLPRDGWADAMAGRCEVVDLPHWHFHLLRDPAVRVLAEHTADFLRRQDLG